MNRLTPREVGQSRGVGDPEPLRQPAGVVGQVLQQEGERLGGGGVAQAAELERQLGRHVRELLGMAALVKQDREVLTSADRGEHQVHLGGRHHRRAERARRLAGTGLQVKHRARRRAGIDAERAHRLQEARHQSIPVKQAIVGGSPAKAGDVRAAQRVETEAERPPQLRIKHLGQARVGGRLERRRLRVQRGQVDALGRLAQLAVAGKAQVSGDSVLASRSPRGRDRRARRRSPGWRACFDPRPSIGVGFVGLHDGGLPIADRLGLARAPSARSPARAAPVPPPPAWSTARCDPRARSPRGCAHGDARRHPAAPLRPLLQREHRIALEQSRRGEA